MKRNLSLLVSTLFLVLLAGCTKDEEVLTGTIAGFVSDYTNANTAIAGATVTLNTKGITKTTGSDGRFEFTDLEPGTYSISVSANNFQANTKQVTVYAAQTVNCDFQLEKSGARVEITPQNLSFGKDVEQLSFSIKNNDNQSQIYSISNAPDFIEVSPASGTVAAKSTQSISVHIKERSSITTNRSGQLTVNVGNDSYIVSINVSNSTSTDPNQGGGANDPNQGQTSDVTLTRGLLAFYNFDNETSDNAYRNSNHGTITGTANYVTDTPNGKGKALSIETKAFMTIPNNLVENKSAFTVSMWVKDFGTGPLFTTINGNNVSTPSIIVLSSNNPQLYYNSWYSVNLSCSLEAYQSSGWHMITYAASNSDEQVYFYIDGKRIDNNRCGRVGSTGSKMVIGGDINNVWADPMIVDNIRIHSVTLSDNEIKQIFDAEK